jgi:hypothetical protein
MAPMVRLRLLSRLALVLTVGVLLISLPACGGDDDDGGNGPAETTETTEGQ